MSSKTLVKKVILCDTAGSEGANDVLGLVQAGDLAADLIVNGKVKVSSDDTTPDFLENKITAGEDVEVNVTGIGGDEKINICSNGKLRVSSSDTVFDYLDSKIGAGTYLTKSVDGVGADETVIVDLDLNAYIGLHTGFVNQVINSANIRDDETEFDVVSTKIKPDGEIQKNIQYREDATSSGSLGILENIGSAQTMSSGDWDYINGLLFTYCTNANNWFNIKDGGSATNGDVKPISTNAGDIKFVKRATFAYDKTQAKWVLLSYSTAKWMRRDQFKDIDANTDVVVSERLPQIGYYHFDVYAVVTETTSGYNDVDTEISQELTVKSITDSIKVDLSGYFVPDENAPSVAWRNKSLQGSGIIHVGGENLADRKVSINASLLNGDLQEIEDGYIHLIYLGELIDA